MPARQRPTSERATGPLDGLRVIDLTDDSGRFATKLLAEAGASVVLLNPLGAQTPTLPYQPSPYYASTRRFRNAVYLHVEDVEGAKQVDVAQEREATDVVVVPDLPEHDRPRRPGRGHATSL